MLEPRDLAKWSSTVPVENKISSVSHFLNILRTPCTHISHKLVKDKEGFPLHNFNDLIKMKEDVKR